MENEHKIIIVMLAIIIYLVLDNCNCKDTKVEGFKGDCGPKPMHREGYRGDPCPPFCPGHINTREGFRGDYPVALSAQHINTREGFRGDYPVALSAQHINTREDFRNDPKIPHTSFAQHINSTDISGGQFVRHHIRNNLKNSMINHINNGN
jgi:hypothetical protein